VQDIIQYLTLDFLLKFSPVGPRIHKYHQSYSRQYHPLYISKTCLCKNIILPSVHSDDNGMFSCENSNENVLAFRILPDTLLGPLFVLSYAKSEGTTELTP